MPKKREKKTEKSEVFYTVCPPPTTERERRMEECIWQFYVDPANREKYEKEYARWWHARDDGSVSPHGN